MHPCPKPQSGLQVHGCSLHHQNQDTEIKLLGFSIWLNHKTFWFFLFIFSFGLLKYVNAFIFLLLFFTLNYQVLVFIFWFLYFSFEFLIFLVFSFEFLYAFKLSFYLGFANPDSQTNKLHAVQTFHCILYTVHYVP